jgi:hypothetical protein
MANANAEPDELMFQCATVMWQWRRGTYAILADLAIRELRRGRNEAAIDDDVTPNKDGV